MALKDHLYSPRHLVLNRKLGASLKDMVTQDGVKCRHVRTHFQVADAFTKAMDPDLLIEVLSTGKVTLQGDAPKKVPAPAPPPAPTMIAQFRKARKQRKRERKQLKTWR